jgi:hypothetical protein
MSPDQHFDLEILVDFARGLASPSQQADIRDHMTVCQTCSETAELLANVWRVGHTMEKGTVPEEWSRKAEQILGDHTFAPIRQLPVHTAVLAFDSFQGLTPEHVRAAPASVRHMAYEAMNCSLYLKVDQVSERRDISIVGQITDRRSPDRAISSTPILLLAGSKVLASTSSNEFGEFQLACKPKRRMSLSFPFEGSRIDVVLDDVLKEDSHRP